MSFDKQELIDRLRAEAQSASKWGQAPANSLATQAADALEASSRQEERLRSAIAYALPLVSKDIDDAMKVRRANRDVIEELEGYERTLKAALEPPHAKEQG